MTQDWVKIGDIPESKLNKVCPAIQGGSLPTVEESARDPRFREAIVNGRLESAEAPTFINLCNDASTR